MREVIIVGAGDHARVIADLVRSTGATVAGFVEPGRDGLARARAEPLLGDLRHDLDWRPAHPHATFVVAIGAGDVRRAAFDRCLELGMAPATLVHPTAVLLGGARVGAGSQVCAQALIGVDATVAQNVIVNTAATLDHDVVVEDHAFIGPGARLAGRVRVGPGAHVGLAAVVREGTMIGAGALIAAGAVVVADVPAGGRVAGVPARPMKSRSEGVS